MVTKSLPTRGLTIGYLARRTGLATSAIRYYEDEGLLTPDRNAAGHRRYERSDLRQGRVTARDRYEKVFFDKGGNRIGIARGTNAIDGEVFPEGRPEGDRDSWSVSNQEDILIAEIAARREVVVENAKKPEESQREVNARLVKASKDGAAKAKGFLGWLSS